MLHENGKQPEEIDWKKVTGAVDEIMREEESFTKEIVDIGDKLISYSKRTKTNLVNTLEKHTRKVADRLREILGE